MADGFQEYRATRTFHIGEISKVATGAQSDIREGEIIEFNGEFCVFRGNRYKAPGLRGAIQEKWLVARNEEFSTPIIPIIRDEVSRPRKSQKEEPAIVFKGLTLKDYNFKLHWKKREKLIQKMDNPEVLKEILKQESGAMVGVIEARLKEVEKQLETTKREQIKKTPIQLDADDTLGLIQALNDGSEIVELTEEQKSKVFQTPNGKKIRKPLQRDVMEHEEKPSDVGVKKIVKSKKEPKIEKDTSLIEGSASNIREFKLAKDETRKNRKNRT